MLSGISTVTELNRFLAVHDNGNGNKHTAAGGAAGVQGQATGSVTAARPGHRMLVISGEKRNNQD